MFTPNIYITIRLSTFRTAAEVGNILTLQFTFECALLCHVFPFHVWLGLFSFLLNFPARFPYLIDTLGLACLQPRLFERTTMSSCCPYLFLFIYLGE